MVAMKDAANCLRRFEIGSVAPAVGRFATLANTLARPTAVECVLAFQAVARFYFVNAVWFWFHSWFGHDHTVAYGSSYVKRMVTFITILLPFSSYAGFPRRSKEIWQYFNIKQQLTALCLVIFLNTSPAAGADLARGLAAVKKGDFETALKEWLPLARDGDPSAQYNIGQLYRLGRGVAKDYTKASQWYEKAAQQWHSAARHNLAVLYEKGLGVPINYAKAVEWYKKAANQDYGIAQFNLAVMYQNGLGVPKDLVHAMMWYRVAEARGFTDAAVAIEALRHNMTDAQISKAERLARQQLQPR